MHFKGGLLVYPGEFIIDRISSHTRGEYPNTLVGYIFWFTAGEWALAWVKGRERACKLRGSSFKLPFTVGS